MHFSKCGRHFLVTGVGLYVKIDPVTYSVRVPCVDASGNNDSYTEQRQANAVSISTGELSHFLPNTEVQAVSLGNYTGS